MQALPLDIWACIFSFLPIRFNLDTLRRVCRTWQRVAQQRNAFGPKLQSFMYTDNTDVLPHNTLLQLPSAIAFRKVLLLVSSDTHLTYRHFQCISPKHVQSLHFEGPPSHLVPMKSILGEQLHTANIFLHNTTEADWTLLVECLNQQCTHLEDLVLNLNQSHGPTVRGFKLFTKCQPWLKVRQVRLYSPRLCEREPSLDSRHLARVLPSLQRLTLSSLSFEHEDTLVQTLQELKVPHLDLEMSDMEHIFTVRQGAALRNIQQLSLFPTRFDSSEALKVLTTGGALHTLELGQAFYPNGGQPFPHQKWDTCTIRHMKVSVYNAADAKYMLPFIMPCMHGVESLCIQALPTEDLVHQLLMRATHLTSLTLAWLEPQEYDMFELYLTRLHTLHITIPIHAGCAMVSRLQKLATQGSTRVVFSIQNER